MKKHGEILSFLNFNFNLLKKFSEKKIILRIMLFSIYTSVPWNENFWIN